MKVITASLALVALVFLGCRGDDDDTNNPTYDAPSNPTFDAPPNQPDGGGGGGTYDSIKDLRAANLTAGAAVTVNTAVVTGLAGNYKSAYIEDADGGAKSGLTLFCNWSSSTSPCPVTRDEMIALQPGVTVKVTGTYDVYKGKIEIKPTTVTMLNATPGALPAAIDLTADQVAESSTAFDYQGVLVNVTPITTLTVTTTTPSAFLNTSATGTDCSMGPQYSAFEVTDGTSTIAVETNFYRHIDIGNDPYCVAPYIDGGTPSASLVLPGDTFTKLGGVLDIDPYVTTTTLALYPTQSSQYTYVGSGDHDAGL